VAKKAKKKKKKWLLDYFPYACSKR
jgi:hypothetical protein